MPHLLSKTGLALACSALIAASGGPALAHPGTAAALDYYSERIAASPSSAQLYLKRILLNLDSGDYRQALSDIQRVENLAPDVDTAYLRGVLAYRQHEVAPAIEWLGQSLRNNPHNPQALILRGRSWVLQKQPRLALDDLSRALAIGGSTDPGLVRETALLANSLGFSGRAIALIDAAASATGVAAPQLELIAIDILEQQHQRKAAIMRLNALLAASENPDWLLHKARLQAELKDFDNSLHTLEITGTALRTRKPTPWRNRLQNQLAQLQQQIQQCRSTTTCSFDTATKTVTQ